MSDGRKNKSFLHRIIARSKFDVSIDKFNSFNEKKEHEEKKSNI